MGHSLGTTTYQCLNCRLAQRAEIRVVSLPAPSQRGQGLGAANSAIAMLLALKRCPRCGHYDRKIASHNRHNVRAGLIMYSILLLVIAASLFAIPGIPLLALAITGGVLALGFIALFFRLRARYPHDVESRVTLIGSTPSNQHWW